MCFGLRIQWAQREHTQNLRIKYCMPRSKRYFEETSTHTHSLFLHLTRFISHSHSLSATIRTRRLVSRLPIMYAPSSWIHWITTINRILKHWAKVPAVIACIFSSFRQFVCPFSYFSCSFKILLVWLFTDNTEYEISYWLCCVVCVSLRVNSFRSTIFCKTPVQTNNHHTHTHTQTTRKRIQNYQVEILSTALKQHKQLINKKNTEHMERHVRKFRVREKTFCHALFPHKSLLCAAKQNVRQCEWAEMKWQQSEIGVNAIRWGSKIEVCTYILTVCSIFGWKIAYQTWW